MIFLDYLDWNWRQKRPETAATVDQLTQHHIQKDMNHDQHRCENIISHRGDMLFLPVHLYSR